MKRQILTLAALAATSSAAYAEVGLSTSIAYESKYVFRGFQFADSSIQPGIDLTYGDFYLGSWFNLPVGDDTGAGTTEMDIYGGYGGSLSETLAYDIGFTLYTFPDSASGFLDLLSEDDGTGNNTFEIYGGVSLDAPLSPSLYVYHDFNFNTVTIQGGVGYSFPVADKTSFDLGGTVGYVVDNDDDADYLYGAVTADVSYAFSDDSSIFVGGRFGGTATPTALGGTFWASESGDATENTAFWWGLGFSSDF
ncbi:MAG: TorF family putative porin [Pseudomonadota bacterium]